MARQIAIEVEGLDGGPVHIRVDKPFARVGRDQRSEVPISDGRLLPCQLYLHATEEGLYYVGLAPNSASGWLLPSESVEVGPFRLRAQVVDGTPGGQVPIDLQAKETSLDLVPQLRILSGRLARSTDLRLRRRLTLLGRESPSTRRVNHPSISRVHCAAFFDGRELWMVDLFSSNGTRLAGTKFDSGRVLPGQELKLGSVRFSYLGTEPNTRPEADGSTLEQSVVIVDHNDQAERLDAASRAVARQESDLALGEALREQNARLERERDEFQHRLEQRLAGVREELLKEVGALRQESQLAGQAFQSLSSEVGTTREALFARYAEVGTKLAEEAGAAERAGEARRHLAQALQEAETRWGDLARDLSSQTVELHRQVDEAREAQSKLAGSLKLQHEEARRRLGKARRAHRKRLAAARREFAAEMAALRAQTQEVRQELRSLPTDSAQPQPAATDQQAEGTKNAAELLGEAEKRHDEALLRIEARWKEFADGFERRAGELAQEIADCRRADAQMAESFKRALGEAVRSLQTQERAPSSEVTAVKSELLAEAADLRDQVAALRGELESRAADFAPLRQTLSAMQPILTRFESGEWAADVQKGWQERLQAVTDEARQRLAEIDRQSALDRQIASDRVAVLEGALTAKIADLRGGLDLLREMAEAQRRELRAVAGGGEAPRGQADPPLVAAPLPALAERRDVQVLPRVEVTADDNSPQPFETYENAESAESPEWVISDAVTQRLVDFKANRDRIGRRRLLWSAVAAVLVVIVVSGASIVQLWFNTGEELKNSEAASLPQSRLVNP